MTTKIVREYLPVVEYLAKLSSKEQISHLKQIDKSCLRFLIDFIFNVESGHIAIPPELIDKLRKYKKQIKSIIKKGKSIKCRKKEMCSKNFFQNIFIPLLPVLRSLIQK